MCENQGSPDSVSWLDLLIALTVGKWPCRTSNAKTWFGTKDNAATRCVHELSGCQSRSLLFGQGLSLSLPPLGLLALGSLHCRWCCHVWIRKTRKTWCLDCCWCLPQVESANFKCVLDGKSGGEPPCFCGIFFGRQRLWFTCPRAWAYAAVLGMCI